MKSKNKTPLLYRIGRFIISPIFKIKTSDKERTPEVLDIGLHTDDIKRLLEILQKIVDNNDTVVIIEHNLDVIKTADYIIDLGPEGGDQGGTIVATGTPEEIAKVKESYTGEFLKRIL